jgi:hypothetical protein
MATVVKNFRIKSGLIVEGTTGTINGQNILTETGSDSYILNLVGGATLVKSVESTQLEVNGAGKLSVKSGVFDAAGAAATAQSAAEATAAADATSKANAAQSAAIGAAATDATTKVAAEAALRVSGDAASVSTAAADATSKANAAQAAAEATASADATSKANAAQSAAISAAATDATTKANAAQSAAATDATTKANAAQAAAEATASAALSTAISTEVTNRNSAISTAVAGVVDSAPELLNTLNELAAALGDSPDTITNLTTSIGNKLPLAGGTLTGALTLSGAPTVDLEAATKKYVDDNTYLADMSARGYADGAADDAEAAAISAAATDATAKANAAQSAAISAAATDATTKANAAQSAAISAAATDATDKADAAESNANSHSDAADTAILNGTTKFTAVNVNDLVSQRAVQATLPSITSGSSMISWAKSDYGTAKAWVKFATATHSQISEILLTTDSSNNIAITDFAETGTNGSLGTITASYLSGNIAIEVNTVYANTTVTVVATLIK